VAGLEALPPDFADLAPCGLLLLNRNFEILAANNYFCALAGLNQDRPRPVRLHHLLSVAGRIYLQSRIQPELALRRRIDELVLDLVRPDGVRVPVMLNALQDMDGQGHPAQIRMAIWRAAAKRAYEAEVPKARQAADEASRVKADFLANVSHEIRTPLNGILGVAGVLAQTPLDLRQQEMVAMISSSGVMLERLVSDILDISKVQSGALGLEIRPFDLLGELVPVLDIARLAAEEKNLPFAVSYAPAAGGWFLGDVLRIKQIIGNIVANALKFTETGEIRVEVDVDADGWIEIKIADTGVGFDQTLEDAVFERFHQADGGITRRYGGTGLGLSISKALLDLMEGSITVSSQPGVGSIFTVRLRLARTPAAPQAAAAADPPPVAGRLRILLCEDNPANQRLVQLILDAFEVDLQIADDGAQGLAHWRCSEFDLVLMDMQMPVMDGYRRYVKSGALRAAAGDRERRSPC
jgi:signal transduction histidine kinase